MRSVTSFYRGTQVDFVAIGEYLPSVAGYRDSPPRIIVRAHGLRRSGESVVLVEFTTTEGNEIAAASTSVMERLGLERKVQRAILRVPPARSQDLLSDDAR
jgi:hypothetical protein